MTTDLREAVARAYFPNEALQEWQLQIADRVLAAIAEHAPETVTELVRAIRQQNWKNGGTLVMDEDWAVAFLAGAKMEARAEARAKALEEALAAAVAAEEQQDADHGAANTGGAQAVADRIRALAGSAGR